jgi:hypothetical protein
VQDPVEADGGVTQDGQCRDNRQIAWGQWFRTEELAQRRYVQPGELQGERSRHGGLATQSHARHRVPPTTPIVSR